MLLRKFMQINSFNKTLFSMDSDYQKDLYIT
jgi:hypothetical protein